MKVLTAAALCMFAPWSAQAAEKTAVFAGGCFWSMEHAFEGVEGIKSLKAGFAGGHVANPSYELVSQGATGHREAVEVTYDPDKLSYQRLLDVYWRNTDPFDARGQFCDKGDEYRPAVFTDSADEKAIVMAEKKAFEARFKKPVATEILPSSPFYAAENYHQHYADLHPFAYGSYRTGCGRDAALRAVWGSEAGGDAFRKGRDK